MGEQLIDDLARALTEQMPRRRALRLLGSMLIATSLPGTAFARSRRPGRSAKCGVDQRVCREFTDEEYCCPRPSWRWFCGSKPGQCLNMCKGPTQFPCTAKYEDRYAGFNGVCCDRRFHVGCDPGSPDDKRPNCIPCFKTCGPDPLIVRNAPLLAWTCCKKPNTCKNGTCKCPNGEIACNGTTCCPKTKPCVRCIERTSYEDPGQVVGAKCCPRGSSCCGTKCCPGGNVRCCGDKCCRPGEGCGGYRGADMCCPPSRYLGGIKKCCPPGTVANSAAKSCCPPGDPACCPQKCKFGQICDQGTCAYV